MIFLALVRPFGGPLVLHFHAGGQAAFAAGHKLAGWFLRKAYGKASVAVISGESVRPDAACFEPGRIEVVPLGVEMPAGTEAGGCRPDDGRLKILYAGVHMASKGIFDLLDTARELKARGRNFLMRTAGSWYEDCERRRFEEKRRELGLEDMVQTLGQQSDSALRDLYRWADVLFFPTFYECETCGMVQLEAMAFGLPVVASRWRGPIDVVEDGGTGLLFNPHDVNGFADGLERLAADSELRVRMGRAGRTRYEREYTLEKFIQRMELVLRGATQTKGRV